MASRLLDLLFIEALHAWSDTDGDGGSPGWLTAALDRSLGPALWAIHRHPEQPWSVEEPVGLASLSRAAFAVRSTRLAGDRAPLLFISGGNDHLLPPAVQRENYEKNATRWKAITAYTLFDGRSHYTCGEAGWQAVADLALDWALPPPPPATSTSPDGGRLT
ncbi:hypothetical protein HHL19_08815 [Streptomyces sp. R302]|uniref:hypothetical protein n=1 Tax=unclassified Streptomyces TaxID=2593676 RepID=UPI00145CC464|nr:MULTISPECIES: hypothetical protein [unclassified Streptomyces]NML52931.1 hypothetical protein [Streptomyces sp. R301]NML78766.1 hypothetical protein [Streptomyces sp. R302]